MDAYPVILRGKNENNINIEQRPEEDSTSNGRGVEGSSQTTKYFAWVSLIKAVSKLTRWDFDKTLQSSVDDFFSFATFCIWEQEREKKMIEDFRKGIKH